MKSSKFASLFSIIIMSFLITPVVSADTGDIIDSFLYYSNACPGYANTVWVDADGIYNGATYGNYDTMVVFQTLTGKGVPDGEDGSFTKLWYLFTADKSVCGGGSLDRDDK